MRINRSMIPAKPKRDNTYGSADRAASAKRVVRRAVNKQKRGGYVGPMERYLVGLCNTELAYNHLFSADAQKRAKRAARKARKLRANAPPWKTDRRFAR